MLNDWTGIYTSTYDQNGRLSGVVNPAGLAITYSYDAASRRAEMDQPTGIFTYVHDPAGRISILTNPEGQTTSWSYDAASQVKAIFLANSTQASYTYDNASQTLLLANLTTGGSTLSSFNYKYDGAGNRLRVLEVDGSLVTWTYDPTYQLTNESRSGANSYNITYSYDPVGNQTLMSSSGTPTTYTYNAASQMATSQTSAGLTTSTYDGSGNLLTSLAPGESANHEYLGWREQADPGRISIGDRGCFYLPWRRSEGSKRGFHWNNELTLGRRKHIAGNQQRQCHPGCVYAGTHGLRQPYLAIAERGGLLLSFRRSRFSKGTGEYRRVSD